jgi:hypothetical protein
MFYKMACVCAIFRVQSVACVCAQHRTIQRALLQYSRKLHNLPSFKYKNVEIEYKSIRVFGNSFHNEDDFVLSRYSNDANNKMREAIIGAIVNEDIPDEYFRCSPFWEKMRTSIFTYIYELFDQNTSIRKTELVHYGGRRYNCDFKIILNDEISYNVEFKFNSQSIVHVPQFVSPMNPSKYLESSYEKYYYTHYLPLLAEKFGLPIPSYDKYIDEIHSPTPRCMKGFQEKYYRGCASSIYYSGIQSDIEFYTLAKQLDEESRRSFIEKYDIDIDALTKYLIRSQANKKYMLFDIKKAVFDVADVCETDYILCSYSKEPHKFRYIIESISGHKYSVLLRWKNGNGIAFPAFQISYIGKI